MDVVGVSKEAACLGVVKDFMAATATEPFDLAALRMLSGEVFKATEHYGPGCIFLTGYYEARDIGASVDSWSKYLGIFDTAYADDDAFLPVFAVLIATHELPKKTRDGQGVYGKDEATPRGCVELV